MKDSQQDPLEKPLDWGNSWWDELMVKRHVHPVNVLHRNLKSSNLFMNKMWSKKMWLWAC